MSILTDWAILQAQVQNAAALLNSASANAVALGQEIAALVAGTIPSNNYPQPTPSGQTYYVSANGSDTNDGKSTSTAWASIAKVNATTFAHGDAVLFRGGDVFVGNLSLTPIRFPGSNLIGAYGTGNAVINTGSGHGIEAVNVAGLSVFNLIVLGYGGATNKGVYIHNDGTVGQLAGPTLKGLTVTGFGSDGILLYGSPGFANPYIGYCISYGNTGADPQALTSGIAMWAGGVSNASQCFLNPTVEHNQVYSNPGLSGPNWSGSGIFMQGVKGGVNQYNDTYSNGSACQASNGSGPVGNWCADSDGIVFQFDRSWSNSSLTADGGGFDLDGGCINCLIQFCLAHDNRSYGMTCYAYEGSWGNNTIRYNVFVNNIGQQLSFGGTGATLTGTLAIHNNILIGDNRYTDQSWHAVIANPDWEQGQFPKVILANNIISAAGGGWLMIINGSAGSVVCDHNDYAGDGYVKWNYNTFSTVASWGQDAGATTADPKLDASYRFLAGSPMIGAGVNVTTKYSLPTPSADYFGAAITNPPNIGAGD
jgi:hypothetical protein